MLEQDLGEMAGIIERHTREDGIHATSIAPLTLFRLSNLSDPVQVVYEPALCIVAQGSKRVLLADEVYRYDPAHYLLVSVDLPVAGQVIEATPELPYLSLRIDLDLGMIGELLGDVEPVDAPGRASKRGLVVNPVEPGLLDAVVRLLRLLDDPRDVKVLGPLVLREISYRLLIGEQGLRLRQIAAEDGQAMRIARAIRWIKGNFDRPLRIEVLAREVHMSASALHHHFKAVTAMSPLQYQKQLRLQEARRLMLSEDLDASAAGYRVGYESASQFSREYRRLFGVPPRRDLLSLRSSSQLISTP
ncbi:AraC family transcriptional regulator N-terminal domain-containing protein [Singulisphaera sp. PoT]|uniref:AraC family transcriptional regulator n=1 Tax=Singulisphaera sp. PoT TaxID=3411797 RepID=UPI003BF604A3